MEYHFKSFPTKLFSDKSIFFAYRYEAFRN